MIKKSVIRSKVPIKNKLSYHNNNIFEEIEKIEGLAPKYILFILKNLIIPYSYKYQCNKGNESMGSFFLVIAFFM